MRLSRVAIGMWREQVNVGNTDAPVAIKVCLECLRAKGVVVEEGHSLGRVHEPCIPFRVKAPYDALVRALRSSGRQPPLKPIPQHHHRDVGIISAPLPLRIAIPYPRWIRRPMPNPRNVGLSVRIRRGVRRDTAQRRASDSDSAAPLRIRLDRVGAKPVESLPAWRGARPSAIEHHANVRSGNIRHRGTVRSLHHDLQTCPVPEFLRRVIQIRTVPDETNRAAPDRQGVGGQVPIGGHWLTVAHRSLAAVSRQSIARHCRTRPWVLQWTPLGHEKRIHRYIRHSRSCPNGSCEREQYCREREKPISSVRHLIPPRRKLSLPGLVWSGPPVAP